MLTLRRSMLLSTLGSVTSLVIPKGTAAQSGDPSTPNFSSGADVNRVWVGPLVVGVRADSALTSGHYGLAENLVRPGAGVPLHVHSKEDEALCIIAGELEVTVGDLRRAARAGDIVFMPRNIPHRFQNGGDQPARMLIVFSPGGFERGFLEVGRPVRDADDVPPALTPQELLRVQAVAERYGVRWI